jgi:GT2 family glycosyltransferase
LPLTSITTTQEPVVAPRVSVRGRPCYSDQQRGGLAVSIPTCQRPDLLRLLLEDIARQTVQPDLLIVVDGDPQSGDVRRLLRDMASSVSWRTVYLASNHANLPYQRYLGWKASVGYRVLLYLDDDLRILQRSCLEKLVAPLAWCGRNIVGVTAHIAFPRRGKLAGVAREAPLWDRRGVAPRALALFGAGRHVSPGGLTPSGHRKLPRFTKQLYAPVDWLHGGVMAYRRDALTADCFSDDLFALAQLGCGLGEDTVLSRRVAGKGELLYAFCAHAVHPGRHRPRAYATDSFRLGYATAFSRRLINDNYRGLDPPQLTDRIALLKSYVGTGALEWVRAVGSLRRDHFDYSLGYSLGATRGLLRAPSASRVTPNVEWWLDAETAFVRAEHLRPLVTAML